MRLSSVRLWHSALLFILAFGPFLALTQSPANFQISTNSQGILRCANDDQILENVSYSWKIDGVQLENETTETISNEVGIDKVECLASNSFGTSYAFLKLTNESYNESSLQVELTFDSPILSCKCNGACKNFKWIKNGASIQQDDFYKVAVISDSEQQLELANSFFDASGTYGCLVESELYQEIIVDLDYKPDLYADNTIISFGDRLNLSCAVRSQSQDFQISWKLDNQLLECNQTCQILNNTELIVPSLTKSGNFRCIAYDEFKEFTSDPVQVEIFQDIPTIIGINATSHQGIAQLTEKQFMILENSELILNCNHNGSHISWSLPDHTKVEQVNPLVIDSVDIEVHQGNYFCTASNSVGNSVQSHLELVIVQGFRIKEPESRIIEAEEGLQLTCDAIIDERLMSSVYFEWRKNEEILQNFNSSSLSIDQVTKKDAGDYKCILKSTFSFIQSVQEQWTVKIKQAPEIFPSFPSSLPLIEGESVTLKCLTKGIPSPNIEWVKSGDLVEILPRNVILLTKDLDASAEIEIQSGGIYMCKATNDYGQTSQGIEVVSVQRSSLGLSSSNQSSIVTNAGSSITLDCGVEIDPKLHQFGVEISWWKNQTQLEITSSNYTIPYLIDREHSGTYYCTVKTAVDEITSSQILEIVTEPPQIQLISQVQRVTLGHNSTLTCQVTGGIPPPTIQWKFKGEKISENSELFLEVPQEGHYQCLAVNEYGSDSKQMELQLISPPELLEGPEDIVMKTLGTVRFPCKIKMDERVKDEVRIEWVYNGTQELQVPLPLHQLVINQVTKDDEGSYTCKITTPFGTLNKTARLTVLGEPPTFIATEKNVRSLELSSTVLSCQANGMPLPEVYWKKQGKNLTISDGKFSQNLLGDLTINSVSLVDQGSYNCVATNIYGTISTQVEMEVIRKSKPSDDQTLAREVVKNVHDNVTLNCGISFDPRLAKETKVQWFRLSQPINLNLKLSNAGPDLKYLKLINNSLLIHDLGVDDKGKYLCSVKTPYESLEYSVQLFVHGEPPKILSNFKKMTLYEGQDLELPCLARGVPQPQLKWFFNDKPLREKYITEVVAVQQDLIESRIYIPKVSKIHEGVYQCEAANTYGSGVAKFANINVVHRTSVQISEEEISVHAGQSLRIPCNYEKDPLNRITNIKWSMNEKDIQVGSKDRVDFGIDGSITISNVQKRHSGIYRCTVTTTLDNATATVPVKVIVNAPVIVSDSGDQIMFSSNTISLLCKANGIPAPKIQWKFNDTDTKKTGEDFIISNAILSDGGIYVCEASNQYGKTSQSIHVKVIHAAPLKPEYLVNLDHDLILPCLEHFDSSIKIETTWRLNGRLITNPGQLLNNGSLHIQRMSETQSGVYSCSASLPNGRRSFVQTNVRLRPDIILSQAKELEVNEGEDVYLECLLVRGVQAKRVWQFNGEYEYGDRTSYENHGGLLIVHKAIPSDSGNYTCLAQKKSSSEEISYKLTVKSNRQHWTPGKPTVSCSQVKDQPVEDLQAFKLDNDTVGITWTLPKYFNQSCFEHIAMTWWTNATDSSFSEMLLPLDQIKVTLSGLETNMTYYVQVNLIAPLNVQVYGHTLKFNLEDLKYGTFPELEIDLKTEASNLSPLALVIISLVSTVVFLIFLVFAYFKWRQIQAKPDHRFARNSVHLRHNSAVSVCCQCTRANNWCYGSGKNDDHMFQKTNFNGFDTGMYEAAIINTSDSSSNSRPTSAPNHKRTSFVVVDKSGDFMQNLPLQWPEPEEAHLGQQEYDPFIAPQHHHNHHHPSTFNPNHQGVHMRRHGSKESISSSWSSLFNVPGTSSAGTVSIRPNSVAVSNLSSSGSAADYAAKVAFIGSKYRNNT